MLLNCALLFALKSRAQNTGVTGFNLQNYFPSFDGKGMWTVNSNDTLKRGEFYFLLESHYSGNQLTIVNEGIDINISKRVLTHNLLYSMGITDYLTVGFDLPYTSFLTSAEFDVDLDVDEPQASVFNTRSFNDMRLFSKWRIKKTTENSFVPGLGFIASFTIPTGDETNFMGEAKPTFSTLAIIENSFNKIRISLNAGIQILQEKHVLDVNVDDRLIFGGGVRVPSHFFNKPIEFIMDALGSYQIQNKGLVVTPLEYHLGIRKLFHNGWGLQIGGGGAFTNAYGNPDYRAMFGIFYKGSDINNRQNTGSPQDDYSRKQYIPEKTLAVVPASPEKPMVTQAQNNSTKNTNNINFINEFLVTRTKINLNFHAHKTLLLSSFLANKNSVVDDLLLQMQSTLTNQRIDIIYTLPENLVVDENMTMNKIYQRMLLVKSMLANHGIPQQSISVAIEVLRDPAIHLPQIVLNIQDDQPKS